MKENTDKKLTIDKVCLLHSKVNRSLRNLVAKNLKDFDITMMEWLTLTTLCSETSESNPYFSMSEISNELNITAPQVNALSAQLQANRWVERSISKYDKRVHQLKPTKKGAQLVHDIERNIEQDVLQTWAGCVSKDDFINYTSTLKQLSKNKPVEAQ